MSLVTEDGTGKSDAESLCTVAVADAYHSARGNTAWDALDNTDDKEPALRKATDYMTAVYRDRWEGVRYSEDQALDWPRYGVVRDSWQVDIDEVPTEVQNACAELALKAYSATLMPDLKQAKTAVTVGPIKTEWSQFSPQQKRYKFIDAMLRPYLNSGAGCCVKMVRA